MRPDDVVREEHRNTVRDTDRGEDVFEDLRRGEALRSIHVRVRDQQHTEQNITPRLDAGNKIGRGRGTRTASTTGISRFRPRDRVEPRGELHRERRWELEWYTSLRNT